jgi:short-subunit dehydrogenase
LSQEVVPIMKANGAGRIINIASQMGSIAEQNLALYGLTKGGLDPPHDVDGLELAPATSW